MRDDVPHSFTASAMDIVRFCARECELQESGELSVYHMVSAWDYAQLHAYSDPTEEDIQHLGAIVEPRTNLLGYRQVGVRVGWDIKLDPALVPIQMTKLVGSCRVVSPSEWYRLYEEVHPFADGNGRTGQILYNWLMGTLDAPTWAPDHWKDRRRSRGWGAPGVRPVKGD